MGGVIKIIGNLFRKTSSTFCYIKTVAISEFFKKKLAILDVSKTRYVDLLITTTMLSAYWSLFVNLLYLPADGHSKLDSGASCDTFRCYIHCTYHDILPSEYLPNALA